MQYCAIPAQGCGQVDLVAVFGVSASTRHVDRERQFVFNVLGYTGLEDEGDSRVCSLDMLSILDQGVAYGSVVVLANEEDISRWSGPSQGKQVVATSFWITVSIELGIC